MSTMQDLLDDLNDRLGDANNAAGAGEVKKMRWINHGVRAMWPRIYTDVSTTIALVDGTYEYALGTDFDAAEVHRVEVENTLGRFYPIPDWVIDTRDGKVINFPSLPHLAGQDLRISAVRPVPAMATTAATYDAPEGTEELPVLYAMGIAAGRVVDPRLLHTRYSTVAAQNGVDINELMNASQFWFAQFELLLDRLGMPWPTSGVHSG